MVWAHESFEFARNVTYPHFLTTNKVTEEYVALAYETCKKRIALAGYRLANLVIDIYEKAKRKDSFALPTTMQEILDSVVLENAVINSPNFLEQ